VFTDPSCPAHRRAEPRLDALLEAEGATAAAYIYRRQPAQRAKRPTRRTRAPPSRSTSCWRARVPALCGEGRDPENRRAAEPSVLVIGIYRANAEALGASSGRTRSFSSRRQAPELVIC